MSYRKPLIGLSIFLVVATIATWMVMVTLRREVDGSTKVYSAVFTDVSGLHAGDDVRMAGVRVGRVDEVELQGTLAKVAFRVEIEQPLYNDTVASVIYQNIIGQRYLGLSPGTSQTRSILPDHGQIPLERTNPSFDIGYLLNGFEPLFTLLDPQQVDNLTSGIIEALQGNSATLLTLITETSALAETVAGPDQVLGEVITNLNKVTTNLAEQSGRLQTIIRESRSLMATVENKREALVSSTGSINSAVSRLATITDNIYPDWQQFIDRNPGFAGHLVGPGRDRLAYLGFNVPYVLKGLARVGQNGSYLAAYPCDVNATIFAFLGRLIPSIVEHATPGGVIQHTPVCR